MENEKPYLLKVIFCDGGFIDSTWGQKMTKNKANHLVKNGV